MKDMSKDVLVTLITWKWPRVVTLLGALAVLVKARFDPGCSYPSLLPR